MRQSGITTVQVISLTLICFSVIVGYMYYTDNGKEQQMWLSYNNISEDYKANGFSMEENCIEEYYYSNAMQINNFGEDGREITEYFPLIAEDFSKVSEKRSDGRNGAEGKRQRNAAGRTDIARIGKRVSALRVGPVV